MIGVEMYDTGKGALLCQPPLPPPLPPPPPPRSNVGWVCLAYLVVVLDFLWFLLQFKYLDLLLKSKTYKPPLEQQPR